MTIAINVKGYVNWDDWGAIEKVPQYITTPWIYENEELWLISISSDWQNRITIANKNLWASSKTDNKAWFVWWNNYDFYWKTRTNHTWTTFNASWYWPWNYYNSPDIYIPSWPWAWCSNWKNLWWWETDTNEAKRWPCDEWYHVPSATEFENLWSIFEALWITDARQYCWSWAWAVYTCSWSTTASSKVYRWMFYKSSLDNKRIYEEYCMASWFSTWATNPWDAIRPFKNDYVIPEIWWTILYQLWQ